MEDRIRVKLAISQATQNQVLSIIYRFKAEQNNGDRCATKWPCMGVRG